ncbi:hypothetical protein GR7B_00155 [Vibrio phage vB_VcorM_GR7B]|nr:hypothetical protein GR7B_00155 [Vibrio phage vB_VcorM_GR7B]
MLNKGIFNFGNSLKVPGDVSVAPPVYDPQRSLRFDSSLSQYLTWLPKVNGNLKQWTYSFWFKRTELTNGFNVPRVFQVSPAYNSYIYVHNGGVLLASSRAGISSVNVSWEYDLVDTTEWYHIVIRADTTQANASDRITLWLNGELLPITTTTTTPALNSDLSFFSTDQENTFGILKNNATTALSQQYDGYLTELAMFDGAADLQIDRFGYFDNLGVWRPSNLRLTIPQEYWVGNSFYLPCTSRTTRTGNSADLVVSTPRGTPVRTKLKPDFLLVKAVDVSALAGIYDRTRGTGKILPLNANPEITNNNTLTSWDDDGYTLGSDFNTASRYASLTLEDNPDFGFDIVTYTGNGLNGRTLAHDLGKLPEMIWIKNRTSTSNWVVWHKDLDDNKTLDLNRNIAQAASTYMGGVTTENFVINAAGNVNANESEYVAYIFTSVDNFCKVGKFTGTGSSSTLSIECGFRPSAYIFKSINHIDSWYTTFSDYYYLIESFNAAVNFNTPPMYETGFHVTTGYGAANPFIFIAWADTTQLQDILESDISDIQFEFVGASDIESVVSLDNPENNLGVLMQKPSSVSAVSPTDGGRVSRLGHRLPDGVIPAVWSKPLTGKVYWEIEYLSDTHPTQNTILLTGLDSRQGKLGHANRIAAYYAGNGHLYTSIPSEVNEAYGDTWTVGDVIGVQCDSDNNTVEYFKNGVSQGIFDYSTYWTGLVYPQGHSASTTDTVRFRIRTTYEEFKYPSSKSADAITLTESDMRYKRADVKKSDIGFTATTYTGFGDYPYSQIISSSRGAVGSFFVEVDGKLVTLYEQHYSGSTYANPVEQFYMNPETRQFEVLPGADFLNMSGALGFMKFIEGSDTYVVIPNYRSDSTHNVTSKVLRWDSSSADDGQFVVHQEIPTSACTDGSILEINGDIFIGLNQFSSEESLTNYAHSLKLMKFNHTSKIFEDIPEIATQGIRGSTMFEVDGKAYIAVSEIEGVNRVRLFEFNPDTHVSTLIQTLTGSTNGRIASTVHEGKAYLITSNQTSDVPVFYTLDTSVNPAQLVTVGDGSTGHIATHHKFLSYSDDKLLVLCARAQAGSSYITNSYLREFTISTGLWATINEYPTRSGYYPDMIEHNGQIYGSIGSYFNGTNYAQYVGYLTVNEDPNTPDDITGEREIYLGGEYDLIWVKSRTGSANSHKVFDTTRGWGKQMSTDLSGPESAQLETNMRGFTKDGFLVGDGSLNANAVNYVAWGWKKDPNLGFDIITYQGDSTGAAHPDRLLTHNCGGEVEFGLVKAYDANIDWYPYVKGVTTDPGHFLQFNTNNALNTSVRPLWAPSKMSPTEFAIGNNDGINQNGTNYIAYLWRSVPGFSKIGTYVGNGNADGPFIDCGFKPAFVLIKCIDSAQNWYLTDSARSPYNNITNRLIPDSSNPEATVATDSITYLSNGFQISGIGNINNIASQKFLYMAFAENPFEHTRAR